jgi:tetratricopeptide (TPR) repeat protein
VAQALTALGGYGEALEHHGRALAIAEALVSSDPANLQALQDLSVRHAQIGDVRLAMGDEASALASYRKSLEIDGRVAARDPTNAKAGLYLAWSHLNVADVLGKRQRPEETAERLDQLRRAIAVVTPFAERDPANSRIRTVLTDSLAGLAEALLEPLGAGRPCPAEARDALARAVSLWDATELEPGKEKEKRDRLAARLATCDRSSSLAGPRL